MGSLMYIALRIYPNIIYAVQAIFYFSVRNMWSRNGMTWSRAGLLQSEWELTTKIGNNLGLSLCIVPRSTVICVVAYFRRTKMLPGV